MKYRSDGACWDATLPEDEIVSFYSDQAETYQGQHFFEAGEWIAAWNHVIMLMCAPGASEVEAVEKLAAARWG